MNKSDFLTTFIVPTGIGASIGGFAGDASPYARLISSISNVIVNPNAVNAACFSGINDKMLYTEGYSIDRFFKGEIGLRPSKFNKIGVIFDKAIPKSVLNVHINTINAVKSTYGLNIFNYAITQKEVGIEFSIAQTGISTGKIVNPDTLIDSATELIEKGAEAIAVVCYFETSEDDSYSLGTGVDPVGGVEAIISHLISREFNIPVAHAPAFSEKELNISTAIVNYKAAAEYITPTFLSCILLGLHNAPKVISQVNINHNDLMINDLNALIMPYNSLGSIPVLACLEKNIPIIAVENNETLLNITSTALKIEDRVIIVKNYFEAAGYLLSLKEGIFLY